MMKAENFILINDRVRDNAIKRINSLDLDGKLKLTISDVGSKLARQRGLQWIWYRDVVNSGIGGKHEESEETLDLASKWRWAKPIKIRDNDLFAELYHIFMRDHGTDELGNPIPERCIHFTKEFIHTESFTVSQMAEYLTKFQEYYLGIGVNLSDPQDWKLLQYGRD